MNLVSNGIKYSDRDKTQRFVEIVPGTADDRECAICIRDNGIGISEDDRSKVFDLYYRAHADLDAQLGADGSGLGLAIVQECVRELGGAISLDSVPKEGSSFSLTLPRHIAPGLPS